MTIGDRIRRMDDEELVQLLVWRSMPSFEFVPGCEDGCDDECGGCALHCPHEKRERAVREWICKQY